MIRSRNTKLRTAIRNAKAENMPKDNIETAIKRASGKDGADIKEVNYEGKGPHGVMLLVECATRQHQPTVRQHPEPTSTRAAGRCCRAGRWNSCSTARPVIEFEKTEDIDLEEMELNLIDAGLEEMEVDGRHGHDRTATSEVSAPCAQAVRGPGDRDDEGANLQRIPNKPMEFSDAQLEEIEQLIDRLEDDEDVQAVYTNIA